MTLIEKFYEQEGKKYGVTLSQMQDICSTPFRMLQMLIETDDNIASVRLEYFGLFKLSKRRISYCRFINQKKFDLGKIDEETYLRDKKRLDEVFNLIEY